MAVLRSLPSGGSVADIARALGRNTRSIATAARTLADKGLVRLDGTKITLAE